MIAIFFFGTGALFEQSAQLLGIAMAAKEGDRCMVKIASVGGGVVGWVGGCRVAWYTEQRDQTR